MTPIVATSSTKLALHIPTQRVIHIENADNGLSCNCECLECHEKLEAIQGKVRELFGVLSANNKLTKGFLITNGKFTASSYDFSNGKLIELIDGTKLKGYIELYK